MTSLALHRSDAVSMILLPDRRGLPPALAELIGVRFPDARTLPFRGRSVPERNRWAAQLDEAVNHAARPVMLVASGVGCFAAAWWGRLTPRYYVERVAGALMVDPVEGGPVASLASPRIPLPFASMLVEGDALTHADSLRMLADGWGAETGIGPSAGTATGAFSRLVERWTRRVVEREVGLHGLRTEL
ncbi:alpha/beta hydrolase [Sphingomonas sp. BGYR3]|uniref:alpha/beta hydrolase n=1 Tax=Sphingomonas sp. BGYR3 TaxID=2975483 RepID=UPI0021A30478|nr:alpha/beta hydrolase [Sphingomonas sp. BGYR3]MDG5489619.1 alpha/beta hydrolase [Sphingomonas sp. BGYR3]